MIYMVEMNLIDLSRRPAWDKWYLDHTKMLLSFPGFHATQRFECIHEAKAPFVALHHVEGIAFLIVIHTKIKLVHLELASGVIE